MQQFYRQTRQLLPIVKSVSARRNNRSLLRLVSSTLLAVALAAGCGGHGGADTDGADDDSDSSTNRGLTITGAPSPVVEADNQYLFVPSATTDSGGALTFSIDNAPPWASFDADTGELSGTPGVNDVGTYGDIRIAVSDGADTATLQPFTIEVVLASLTNYALRFYGNGIAAPDLDRVKIRIDDPANSNPGPPVDVGATDFTIEFWLRANAQANDAQAVTCGNNVNWIYGNIVIDRDRFGEYYKYGISIAGGVIVFGVSGDDEIDTTLCGVSNVLDNTWHHVAVQRRRSDGEMWLFVDGVLEGQVTGPGGDVSYPDNAFPADFCDGGPCVNSDPFIVLGAEKHDAGASFPSFSGWLDELRFSTVLRYAGNFTPPAQAFVADADTAALYHFNTGQGINLIDSAAGAASPGVLRVGGNPAGPEWQLSTAPTAR